MILLLLKFTAKNIISITAKHRNPCFHIQVWLRSICSSHAGLECNENLGQNIIFAANTWLLISVATPDRCITGQTSYPCPTTRQVYNEWVDINRWQT